MVCEGSLLDSAIVGNGSKADINERPLSTLLGYSPENICNPADCLVTSESQTNFGFVQG